MPDESWFGRASESLSRSLATRFSRRSFLGNVGRGSLVLAGAGAGSLSLGAGPAQASICGHTSSISCYDLTGSNSCPGTSCGCGYWRICSSDNCQYSKVWSDCCYPNGSCSCTCNTPTGEPSCCFPKEWAQGCGGDLYVKCRRWYCSVPC
jgi:hypothetical protein